MTDTDHLKILQQTDTNVPCNLTLNQCGVQPQIFRSAQQFHSSLIESMGNQVLITYIIKFAEPMQVFALNIREHQEAEGAQCTRMEMTRI